MRQENYFKENKSEINQSDLNEAGLEKAIKTVQSANKEKILDDLEGKLIDRNLTPEDVLDVSRPVAQGGIGMKSARSYIDRIKRIQNAELNEIADILGVKTREDIEYIGLVDKLIDDTVDNFTMKQVLVDAYIDGGLTTQEQRKLDRIRKILKKVEKSKEGESSFSVGKALIASNPVIAPVAGFALATESEWNPFKGFFSSSIEQAKSLLEDTKFSDKAISDALRKIIDYDINMDKNGEELEEAVGQIVKEEQQKVNPPEWSKYKEGDVINTLRGPAKITGFYPDGEPDVELLK